MKRSYLWAGLAVPAVFGGIAFFLKTKKQHNGAGNNSGKIDIAKIKGNAGTAGISTEKPDLDKDIQKSFEQKKSRMVVGRRGNIPKQEAAGDISENHSRKIYTGAKGGKYYLNSKGEKVYLKK